MTKYVFEYNDGVIHEQTHGQGQTCHGHHVEGELGQIQNTEGHNDRYGDGECHDDGGPDIVKEKEEHESCKEECLNSCKTEVSDGTFDEICLVEDHSNLHALRKPANDFRHLIHNPIGHLNRVCFRVFRDNKQDPRLSIAANDTGGFLIGICDPGHILDVDRCFLAISDNGICYLFHRGIFT